VKLLKWSGYMLIGGLGILLAGMLSRWWSVVYWNRVFPLFCLFLRKISHFPKRFQGT
jgi:hypothetical protein